MTMRILIALIFSFSAFAAPPEFSMLFKKKKPIMAAIMLNGEYESEEGKQEALDKAMEQLRIVKEEGVDSILYEFRGGDIMTPPITEANFKGMVEIMRKVIAEAGDVVIGVEILWHFPHETLLLAKESGARYVRVDFFSDRMIADGNEVPIDPAELMEYKRKIGADDVFLMTDIQVKYADMVDPSLTMAQSAANAEAKGSNSVIVSGKTSGNSPGGERVCAAREGVTNANVVIGSGFDYKNAPDLLRCADGAIVGTSISTETGGWLVPWKVRRLMDVVESIREGN